MLRRRLAAALGLVLTAALGLVACSGDDGPSPRDVAQEFLDKWGSGDVAGAAGRTDDASSAQAVLQQVKESLAATKAELRAGDASEKDGRATVPFTASWTLPGAAGPWTYDGELALVEKDDAWLVTWQPSIVHPELGADQELVVTRALPDRAPILDAAGQPLFAETPVVIVGIQPNQVKDLPGLAGTLAASLNTLTPNPNVEAAQIVADVRKAAKPDQFVTVITLRRPDYLKVKPVIHPLKGTVFREEQRVLGPTPNFAQPFLGRVGEVTKEILDESQGAFATGDKVGVSGLQRALNDQLTGQAGLTISVRAPSEGETHSPGEPTEIGTVAGKPGTAVTLTLDRTVQDAADRAVAGVPKKAAIVAVRPSTGEILAVANGPTAGFDMAMTAQVPAGSTFKIVTAATALQAGVVTPATPVNCPGRITVGGRQFQNENAFALGQVPMRTAFARSCNTTMIDLSQRLDGNALTTTAAQFGVGAGWQLPVASFSGSIEAPKDKVELAADAIGQGKVLVSPFSMALVAATVQKGSTPAPMIVKGQAATAKNPPKAPSGTVVATLRDFTRAVVTEGTATALGDLPGEPVSGKTGTAEYGTEVPPRSHAWFVGYRGDLAFAVFVEDGQSSRSTAVPVARAFLQGLG